MPAFKFANVALKANVISTLIFMFCFDVSGDDQVDFAKQIAPILQTHCQQCHGEKVREGGLRFTNRGDALLETDSSAFAILPGKPDQSELLSRVTSNDDLARMPPEGPRLSNEEIATLRQWILEGASWPDDETPEHWAYIPPTRPKLPTIQNTHWPKNPIDYFVLRRLEQNNLAPSPPADPAKLIRRTSLALTGLPPSLSQVDAFLANPSEASFEAFVDQCLDSKSYGERWAQPWLDLARYADSNGFQADQLRDSWAYRDWVIRAMNADMPFDQFTIEQLAGDLLPNATVNQKIATGFHRSATCNVEAGVHPEENRINQVFDRVNTTGTVFLGTTIECCQCHNHKYDPFTQEEYYELFAYFNNTPVEVKLQAGVQYNFYGPTTNLPLSDSEQVEYDALKQQLARLDAKKKIEMAVHAVERDQLKQKLINLAGTPANWTTLNILDVETSGGETHNVLQDQSILIGGALPDTTAYQITATSSLTNITAFRIDSLTHPSLPGTGPGRGDEKRANFILSEFIVSEKHPTPNGPELTALALVNPTADFSQKNWAVEKAIDGDLKTGWAIAPQFFKNHWATFELKIPFRTKASLSQFRFLLEQNFGRGRNLGRVRLSATDANPEALAIPSEIRSILLTKNPTAKQQKRLDEYLDKANSTKLQIDQEITRIETQIESLKPATSLVMVELDEQRETFKLNRGNYLSPGKQVKASVPSVLHSLDETLPKNRLGLAKWIVAPENPLLGRVTVNRWWANLLGQGLVRSGEDFGTQSEPASHPELLDWMANELVHNQFSRKHIHKLIVMSSTFRQSSKTNQQRLELDPENRLYTRGPRMRMPAEMIRDHGLAVSGLLSLKKGGPPIMPFQPDNVWRAVGRNAPQWKTATDENRFRRGIYVIWRRAAPYPSFVNFDAPDRAACVVERPRTNTPLQALTLLNDQAYIEMAVALADQVNSTIPNATIRNKIALAMRRCVIRTPTHAELDELTQLYHSELKRFENEPELATVFLKNNRPTKAIQLEDSAKLTALSIVANVLLNLDETINY